MPQLPDSIGNAAAQTRFIESNKEFLIESAEIYAILRKIFVRVTPQSTPQSKPSSPSNSPIETENRNLADAAVFFLGRTAVEDFTELIVLAGNGMGVGAYKILRGMYERIVTAAFIAEHPSEARPFMLHSYVQREKIQKRYKQIVPDYQDKRSVEEIGEFETTLKEAKAHLKESICTKCKQPITQDAWTRWSLDAMAEKLGSNFKAAYVYCYLVPTLHSHATAFGIESRMQKSPNDDTHFFKQTTEDEARKALMFGHGMILRLLRLENTYFQFGLDAEIEARWGNFEKIWRNKV